MAVLNRPAEVAVTGGAAGGGEEVWRAEEAALAQEAGEVDRQLVRSLRAQRHTSGTLAGQPVYTPLVAYTMMLFILLYFPCVAAVAAIRKEAGWRWALFSVLYTTGLAWVVSCAVYQIGSRFF